ncbi:MAG: hypothetical protein H6695_03035 [Deferribacteres bacterium]|nr:hypothetical protein [Deferribacteres bacterium]
MISKNDQTRCLESLLNSQEFSGSKIYNSYLNYLVEAKNAGKELKETTIAFEFFGKDASFNPSEDTIVRSHTYQLRKKLESYYHEEGKDDKCRLVIPKGHYDVKFVHVSDEVATSKWFLKALPRRKHNLFIILILLLAVIYLVLRNFSLEKQLSQYHLIDKSDPIWSDYLQSELPILISVGDHYFFNEYSEQFQHPIDIRHGKINSLEDFEALRLQYPDINLQPTEEPYFPYHSIWSLPPVLSLMYSANQKPILRKSSALTPQMLKEYNMVFLGSIKTLYILVHTLSKSHFRYEILPHKVIYTPPDSSATHVYETSLHSTGPNDDLVLAVKIPGPANNAIFIIASFHSLGAPEIARYLAEASTRAALEEKFEQTYGKMPEYFEVLFRVTGIDKTAYNTEILVFNEIATE